MFISPINLLIFAKNNDLNRDKKVVQNGNNKLVQPLNCDVVSFKQKKINLLEQPKEKIFELIKRFKESDFNGRSFCVEKSPHPNPPQVG